MFFAKMPSLAAKVTHGVKSALSSKFGQGKDCNPFDKDDDDHGKDWGWGKDHHDKGWGHGKDWGHGKGHHWAGGKDKDCDDDQDDDDGDTGGGFPEIPDDTTGITFHVDLTDDDNADEYFYVQKDTSSSATMSFEDYWDAVKADLAETYPKLDPKDIVIKATIYSASEGESYYYFTGDEESDEDDDDKDCGPGHHGKHDHHLQDHAKDLVCKVVAKAHTLKDLADQKFCADLSKDDKSFDDDDKDDEDDDQDDDDDC